MSSEKNKPIVSIIVLTYNHEKYIKKALDSILMQKVNFGYEILVGDDASTDGTVSILKEYYERFPEKIKLYLNEVNVGATRNAYNVLVNAKGDYLATCEGDDYWTDESKLQLQVDFLENNSDFVGCTHKFTIVDENDEKYRSQYLSWIKQKTRFTLSDFQGMFLPGQPGTFVKRNIVKLYGVDISCMYRFHRNVGDKTMMLLCLQYGDFGFIDRSMSIYRKSYSSPNSITGIIARNRENFLNDDFDLLCCFEEMLKKNGFNIKMNIGKRIIFSKCLLYYIYTRKKEFYSILSKIWNEENNKIRILIYVPSYYINRILEFVNNIKF